jgi:hypothetical protein
MVGLQAISGMEMDTRAIFFERSKVQFINQLMNRYRFCSERSIVGGIRAIFKEEVRKFDFGATEGISPVIQRCLVET